MRYWSYDQARLGTIGVDLLCWRTIGETASSRKLLAPRTPRAEKTGPAFLLGVLCALGATFLNSVKLRPRTLKHDLARLGTTACDSSRCRFGRRLRTTKTRRHEESRDPKRTTRASPSLRACVVMPHLRHNRANRGMQPRHVFMIAYIGPPVKRLRHIHATLNFAFIGRTAGSEPSDHAIDLRPSEATVAAYLAVFSLSFAIVFSSFSNFDESWA